jgi:hypothetical protein
MLDLDDSGFLKQGWMFLGKVLDEKLEAWTQPFVDRAAERLLTLLRRRPAETVSGSAAEAQVARAVGTLRDEQAQVAISAAEAAQQALGEEKAARRSGDLRLATKELRVAENEADRALHAAHFAIFPAVGMIQAAGEPAEVAKAVEAARAALAAASAAKAAVVVEDGILLKLAVKEAGPTTEVVEVLLHLPK